MTRIKRGVSRRRRHKKILKMTKGHRAGRHALFRQARESMIHALSYAYAHRREKKGDMRRLWNLRIGAAARQNGLSYSRLIYGLKLAGAQIDRKMLAELALLEPDGFSSVVAKAKEHLPAST